MSVTPNVRRDAVPDLSAISLAERMMTGSASCSLTAWRLDTQYDLVAHGLAVGGDLVVAVRPPLECPLATLPPGTGVEVRLDLVRDCSDPMLRVVAASCHLLGELTFLDRSECARLLQEGELPERVAELAGFPGTRIGFVTTDRVLVHDRRGVTPVPWEAFGNPLADFPRDDFGLHDAVVSQGQGRLRMLCDAVRLGIVPGTATVRPTGSQVCGHVLDRVFCIDVDRAGATLMHIGAEETVTAFIEFPTCPTCPEAVAETLSVIASAI